MGKDKKSMDERIASFGKKKIENLKKRMEEKPPKTQIGKRINLVKLNFLQNSVNKRLDRESIKNIHDNEKSKVYEEYDNRDIELAKEISELDYHADEIARRLRKLEKYDPKLMFESDNKRKSKYMPKGYGREEDSENSKTTIVEEEKAKLLKELDEIEKEQDRLKAEKEKNLVELEKEMAEMDKVKNTYLAEMKSPNIFKRIQNFFKEKYAQYKEKKQEKRDKLDQKVSEVLTNANKTSERESWKVDMSPEEQAKAAQEMQESIEQRKQASKDEDKNKEDNVK